MSEGLSEKRGQDRHRERERGELIAENGEGRQQSASWHVYSFAHYFAAVVVCLLIKDNPIKALKSSLRRSIHTHTRSQTHLRVAGPVLERGQVVVGSVKPAVFHPLPATTNRAWGNCARGLGRCNHNMPPWRLCVGSGAGQSPACLRPPAALSCRVLADWSPSAHMPTYTVFLSN